MAKQRAALYDNRLSLVNEQTLRFKLVDGTQQPCLPESSRRADTTHSTLGQYHTSVVDHTIVTV